MYSKIKIMGHPVHPMLVSFPIAFYVATLFCFIVYALGGSPFWFRAGFVSNIAGVVMAIAAAIPGFLDWSLGIPGGSHAKKDGRTHMILNVTTLIIFAINLWLNSGQWNAVRPVGRLSILLPLVGVILTGFAGSLGWKMVQTHHVGVQLSPTEEKYEERRRRAA